MKEEKREMGNLYLKINIKNIFVDHDYIQN